MACEVRPFACHESVGVVEVHDVNDGLSRHGGYVVVEQFLYLRLERPHVNRLLIPDAYGTPQFREALPIALYSFDPVLVEHVVELFGRQRDMQATAESAQALVEHLPGRVVGQELLECSMSRLLRTDLNTSQSRP